MKEHTDEQDLKGVGGGRRGKHWTAGATLSTKPGRAQQWLQIETGVGNTSRAAQKGRLLFLHCRHHRHRNRDSFSYGDEAGSQERAHTGDAGEQVRPHGFCLEAQWTLTHTWRIPGLLQ